MSALRQRVSDVDVPKPGELRWALSNMAAVSMASNARHASAAVNRGLAELLGHEGWKLLRKSDKTPYESAEDFITHPDGLDSSLREIAAAVAASAAETQRLCRAAVPELREVGRPKGSQKGENKGSATTFSADDRGAAYIVQRLRRDGHASLAAEVIQGERSAASARREAGFGTSSIRVSLHEDPTRAAAALVAKLGASRALELAAAITSQIGGST